MLPKSMSALLIAAVAATVAFVHEGKASETGLDIIHALRREGGRVCMSDHWHYSTGGLKATRAAAQRDAIRAWQDFTEFEYGSTWARFSRAGSRKLGCSHSGGGWTCDVEGRPCK